MRLVWLVQFNFSTMSNYNIGIVYLVSECALAVIASCGPGLRPLFVKWFPGCFGSLAETEDRYGPRVYGRYPSHSRSQSNKRSRMSSMPSSKQRTRDYSEYQLRTIHPRSHAAVDASSPHGSDDAIIPQSGVMMTRAYEVNSEEASRIEQECHK